MENIAVPTRPQNKAKTFGIWNLYTVRYAEKNTEKVIDTVRTEIISGSLAQLGEYMLLFYDIITETDA